ncbi:MAG: hypothetical protein VXZ91_04250 [Pseudomonadota bacterium]|nr:hypothetical protein [Pseudomonadota bacterium]
MPADFRHKGGLASAVPAYLLRVMVQGTLLPRADAMDGNDPSNAAVGYGVANYVHYNGDRQGADDLLRRLVSGSSWSAFGFIAAEADPANPNR